MSNGSNSSRSAGGVSFASLLGLLFIGLKLGGVIHWSWWWVLAPFWVGTAIFLVVAAFLLMIIGLGKVVEEKKARQQRADRLAARRAAGVMPPPAPRMTRIVDGHVVRDRSTWRD